MATNFHALFHHAQHLLGPAISDINPSPLYILSYWMGSILIGLWPLFVYYRSEAQAKFE